ncbi:hypothetical protein KFL_001030140 [Klebsormidium nitens]|uniref:S1 motif domain-containing protein n=1 Tax=Klebsormidium nitens TaxID=105231 RepID=A0A1Y1HYE1_KLENI|nr:hypothetical protein KFL_001030140 [Klebsormidium nitens]|eukprot:GAQ82189.1 hypothetical protein KFL_001030140 [Klebsormidium nitens]
MDRGGPSRRGGFEDGEGGSKSFRGWGKFSKPSTWGTKTKRVWKPKQPPSYAEDDRLEADDLYPVREPVQRSRRFSIDKTKPESDFDYTRREEKVSESGDEVRRKVFGVREEVSQSASVVGEERLDTSERKYGVRDRVPGLRSQVSETRGITERKKDVIKKEYKRPGRIHTEQDRQPWVKGEPRGEIPQQVFGGLRRQSSGLEGEDVGNEGPSASRDLEWGQQIDFKVYQFTPLGMRVIIRGGYDGLVYKDQMELYGRDRIEIGDVMKGWVFKIRDDDKVDVSLRAFGAAQYEADKAYLEEQLIIYGGFIPLNSKSPPQEIAAKLQLTKSGFKKAVGGLMKIGRAIETDEGVVLVEDDGTTASART